MKLKHFQEQKPLFYFLCVNINILFTILDINRKTGNLNIFSRSPLFYFLCVCKFIKYIPFSQVSFIIARNMKMAVLQKFLNNIRTFGTTSSRFVLNF